MATEYILAATMLFGSYASPVEHPISGTFTDPVACMSHVTRTARNSGMTFLTVEGTVCVERQRAAVSKAEAASDDQAAFNKRLRAKLTPEQRRERVALYEGEVKANRWIMEHGTTEQARLEAAERVRKYEGRIAALQ